MRDNLIDVIQAVKPAAGPGKMLYRLERGISNGEEIILLRRSALGRCMGQPTLPEYTFQSSVEYGPASPASGNLEAGIKNIFDTLSAVPKELVKWDLPGGTLIVGGGGLQWVKTASGQTVLQSGTGPTAASVAGFLSNPLVLTALGIAGLVLISKTIKKGKK